MCIRDRLGIGEILEEWTHKKSVDDLAKSMSLNIDKVWKVEEDHEIDVYKRQIWNLQLQI